MKFQVAEELGHRVLGWRTVKTNNAGLGKGAVDTEPIVAQVFVTPSTRSTSDFEQQVCCPKIMASLVNLTKSWKYKQTSHS